MSNSFTSISLMSLREDSASITSLLWSCGEVFGCLATKSREGDVTNPRVTEDTWALAARGVRGEMEVRGVVVVGVCGEEEALVFRV